MMPFIQNIQNSCIHGDRKQIGGRQGLRAGTNCLLETSLALGDVSVQDLNRGDGIVHCE